MQQGLAGIEVAASGAAHNRLSVHALAFRLSLGDHREDSDHLLTRLFVLLARQQLHQCLGLAAVRQGAERFQCALAGGRKFAARKLEQRRHGGLLVARTERPNQLRLHGRRRAVELLNQRPGHVASTQSHQRLTCDFLFRLVARGRSLGQRGHRAGVAQLPHRGESSDADGGVLTARRGLHGRHRRDITARPQQRQQGDLQRRWRVGNQL